jgi:alpha-glucosidase (family GH31 glycosyl hydrolase)
MSQNIHARTHSRTHARMYAHTHGCTHAHMHAHMYARNYAHNHAITHTRTHACTHLHMYSHLHVYTHTIMHTRTHRWTHASFLPIIPEVDIFPTTPVTLRYRTIGGIFDFYVFTGPSSDDVIRQYSEVIGKTFFPPYWSLGFHLSRWGYNSGADLQAVIDRMRHAGMPYVRTTSGLLLVERGMLGCRTYLQVPVYC